MKAFRSILSSLLALAVLVSASSFTVNMHLCGGRLQSVALIEKASPCPMEVVTPPCHGKSVSHQKITDCCQDKELKFEGNDLSPKVELVKIEIQNSPWVAGLLVIMEIIPSVHLAAQSDPSLYKPPLTERDINVFVQSFLI